MVIGPDPFPLELTVAQHHTPAVGESLELSPFTFSDRVRDGNSVMRVIHYPDINLIVDLPAPVSR
jgi:isopenicillin N synthase-like dioxygenase